MPTRFNHDFFVCVYKSEMSALDKALERFICMLVCWFAGATQTLLGRNGMVVANPKVQLEIVKGQPRFYMVCARCNQKKLATTDFFRATSVKGGDMCEWLERGPKGLPCFNNSMMRPCNTCYAQMRFEAIRVHNSVDFWQGLVNNYRHIAWQDAQAKYAQTLHGYVTGAPMKLLVAQAGHVLRIGLHDIEREHVTNGTKHDSDNHMLDTCEFDMAIVNVPQRSKIPDLRQAWIHMFEITLWMLVDKLETITAAMQENWSKKPREVGVTLIQKHEPSKYVIQLRRLHVRYALGRMVRCHKQCDKRAKRPEGNATAQGYFDVLCLHDWRCAVCHVPLTLCDDT